jgi:hypothetical protein
MPRGVQESIGLIVTVSPGRARSTAGPASTTSATISWPGTMGNDTNAASGESMLPCSWIACMSLAQMPESRVATFTHCGPRRAGSGMSS